MNIALQTPATSSKRNVFVKVVLSSYYICSNIKQMLQLLAVSSLDIPSQGGGYSPAVAPLSWFWCLDPLLVIYTYLVLCTRY